MKGFKSFKSCLALALTVVSLGMAVNASADYIGNPTRPDTMWVPAHGCMKGYYIYFREHPCCGIPNLHNVTYVGYTGSWL